MTRSFEGRRSGKPLSGTLGAEAERLVHEAAEKQPGPRDKNHGRLPGNDRPDEVHESRPAKTRFFGMIVRGASLAGT